jgi:hypothetical protein
MNNYDKELVLEIIRDSCLIQSATDLIGPDIAFTSNLILLSNDCYRIFKQSKNLAKIIFLEKLLRAYCDKNFIEYVYMYNRLLDRFINITIITKSTRPRECILISLESDIKPQVKIKELIQAQYDLLHGKQERLEELGDVMAYVLRNYLDDVSITYKK